MPRQIKMSIEEFENFAKDVSEHLYESMYDKFLMQNGLIQESSLSNKMIEYQSKFTKSIYSQEFSDTDSHTHQLGGENRMETKSIVDKFYADSNIKSIYVYEENEDIYLLLILNDDDVEDLALNLAKIQNEAAWEYPNLNIEIDYIPAEYFTEDYIPDGAVSFPRS
ncbi:hypothetical protein [Paenibacillus jiagnxiensis]|uniref:hypothetical protein n=1 Tax=Paenibacillus jiagnxiensis TaxID=3228926 RepID=UPI0033BF62DD